MHFWSVFFKRYCHLHVLHVYMYVLAFIPHIFRGACTEYTMNSKLNCSEPSKKHVHIICMVVMGGGTGFNIIPL